jgi:hypothetical protein
MAGMEEIEWPEGWRPIGDNDTGTAFETELYRELCATHALSGLRVSTLGRRDDRDDFLFSLDDGRVAEVHLTWLQENIPEWPKAQIYRDLDEWCGLSR